MQAAKVLIVDDHAVFRQGVRDALDRQEDLSVVGEAENGLEALSKARELHPDVILLDVMMPGYDGQDTVCAIKRELPEIKGVCSPSRRVTRASLRPSGEVQTAT